MKRKVKPLPPPRPLLSMQDAIDAVVKAACKFDEADWNDPQVYAEELIEALGDAVQDYRRSQREYVAPKEFYPNIDDLRGER